MATLTWPGAEMTPVLSFTVNFVGLMIVAARGVELTSTSDEETKLLPVTVSVVPFCTCVKGTVLGASDPISGAGRALPHSGFRVLLQPTIEKARETTASRQANGRA